MIVLKTVAHRLFTDKGCRADLCELAGAMY